jgi:hypothetical protein
MPERKLKDAIKADFRSMSAKQAERLESGEDDRTYWALNRLELLDHVNKYHLINDNTLIWSIWSLILEVRTYRIA